MQRAGDYWKTWSDDFNTSLGTQQHNYDDDYSLNQVTWIAQCFYDDDTTVAVTISLQPTLSEPGDLLQVTSVVGSFTSTHTICNLLVRNTDMAKAPAPCEKDCGKQDELDEPELEAFIRAPCFSLLPPCGHVVKTPPPKAKPPTPDEEPEIPKMPCPVPLRPCDKPTE